MKVDTLLKRNIKEMFSYSKCNKKKTNMRNFSLPTDLHNFLQKCRIDAIPNSDMRVINSAQNKSDGLRV